MVNSGCAGSVGPTLRSLWMRTGLAGIWGEADLMAEIEARNPSGADAVEGLRSRLSRRRLMLVVGGVMLGMLLSALDQTIVGTAMPRIIADLNGLDHYAWVFTAYML